ncbi:hypothetical protein ADS46_10920 [Halomonas sp. G11]|nr:hypothetical protein ADS46_10920 [Halomonas sp. G11]
MEPEVWLLYLYGQKLDDFPHLKNAKPRFKGMFLRLAIFLYGLFSQSFFFRKPKVLSESDILVYAGSKNQKDALKPTVERLLDKGINVVTLVQQKVFDNECRNNGFKSVFLGPREIVKVLVVFFIRFPALYLQLRKRHKSLLLYKIDAFCESYKYLVYFDEKLKECKPKIILVSNDHNVDTRSLLAIARTMGIKTAYLQHASVSHVFPALMVDYAFLDGLAALDVYKKCRYSKPHSIHPKSNVFLSGQKKSLGISKFPGNHFLGLALNKLDKPEDIEVVIASLHSKGIPVLVRWHPGLQGKKLKPILNIIDRYTNAEKSNPLDEPVGKFISRLDVLVAANSSIHLEAALMKVVPIYYEYSPVYHHDYYGYVEKKICYEARSVDEIINLYHEAIAGLAMINKKAIQFFSATYETEWEGKEGELVAKNLYEILHEARLESLWGYLESNEV